MAAIDGIWNIVIQSPAGEQKGTLTVRSAVSTFTGTFTGDEGAVEIADGKAEGEHDQLEHEDPQAALPMTLTSKLTLEGDALTGAVTLARSAAFRCAARVLDLHRPSTELTSCN